MAGAFTSSWERLRRDSVYDVRRLARVASIARGRRWLDELIVEPTASAERIAKREGCSTRKVNMTISLAFLAADFVGVARLCDMPVEWCRQWRCLACLRNSPVHQIDDAWRRVGWLDLFARLFFLEQVNESVLVPILELRRIEVNGFFGV